MTWRDKIIEEIFQALDAEVASHPNEAPTPRHLSGEIISREKCIKAIGYMLHFIRDFYDREGLN